MGFPPTTVMPYSDADIILLSPSCILLEIIPKTIGLLPFSTIYCPKNVMKML